MKQGRENEAIAILKKIYPAHELDNEVEALRMSVQAEIAEEGSIGDGGIISKIKTAWTTPIVRKGLIAGIGCQVAQQLVGINTVMYYSPTIIQFAGIASNRAALALSLTTSGLNAIGSIISIAVVDKYGRRRLMIVSMIGIIVFLFGLTAMFKVASDNSPPVGSFETTRFGNSTCPSYITAPNAASWDCMKCLQASAGCGYCSNKQNKVRNR